MSHMGHPTDDDDTEQPRPPAALADYVDVGSGAGSMTAQEDWVRSESKDPTNDGRSPTNTYFNPDDVDGQVPPWQHDRKQRNQRSWRDMATIQDGAHNKVNSRGGQNWHADKRRWVQMYGRKMGATDFHIERALDIVDHLDLNQYKYHNSDTTHITAQLVLLCMVSLLIDADINSFDQRALTRDGTTELLDILDADVSEYEKVRSLLRQKDSELLFPSSDG